MAVIRSRRTEVIVALQNVARVLGFGLTMHNNGPNFSSLLRFRPPSCNPKKYNKRISKPVKQHSAESQQKDKIEAKPTHMQLAPSFLRDI